MDWMGVVHDLEVGTPRVSLKYPFVMIITNWLRLVAFRNGLTDFHGDEPK